MNVYVGTSGYSYKEWKGTFYPKDLYARKMLHLCGECFRRVEINSTFNGTPKTSVVEGWAQAVRGDFKFALKAPTQITHLKGSRRMGGACRVPGTDGMGRTATARRAKNIKLSYW
jgi:uncharacterized protein YecE (DUF72 family)